MIVPGVVVRCPKCQTELLGLAIHCADCGEYVDEMGFRPTLGTFGRISGDGLEDGRLEAEVQLAITRAVEPLGFFVYDLSQGRKTRQTPGLADLYIVGYGRCAWVEVKTATGTQEESQKAFGERVLENGGEYHVWRHEDEAIAWAMAARRAEIRG